MSLPMALILREDHRRQEEDPGEHERSALQSFGVGVGVVMQRRRWYVLVHS